MIEVNRLIMLNQMAGPLFRELAEELPHFFKEGVLLVTGHPDSILNAKSKKNAILEIIKTPVYNRKSKSTRVFSWIKYLFFCSSVILKSKKTDAFLLSSNPPILFAWFRLLTILRKRSYIVLIYDIHPDVFVLMGLLNKHNPIVKLWHLINKRVFSNADAIVTLGKHMAKRILKNYSICQEKIHIVYPWVDTDIVKPIERSKNPLANEFNESNKYVILYSGNMGISHDIETIMEVSKRLRERDDILFIFIGGGEKWQQILDFKNKFKLENVKVHSFRPEEQLPYTLSLSNISIVSLGIGAEELMIPSKLFYYMASGAAVIGICKGQNDLRDIIQENNCGICIEPNNPDKLMNSIESLVDNKKLQREYSSNSRISAIDKFSKKNGIETFINILTDINFISNEK